MKEKELAIKYYRELENLKTIREPFECSISVPLHGSELKNVDLEILKKELKSFGLFSGLQRGANDFNFINDKDERFIISVCPLE